MKAASGEDELKDAKKALSVLGVKLNKEFNFVLPVEESDRVIFTFDKVKTTPKKYPRKPGMPNKMPIQ